MNSRGKKGKSEGEGLPVARLMVEQFKNGPTKSNTVSHVLKKSKVLVIKE